MRFMRLPQRILLGFYHPEQWDVVGDDKYSPTLATIHKRILVQLDAKNVIVSSGGWPGRRHGTNSRGRTRPSAVLVMVEPANEESHRDREGFSLVTIGRFVPFKTMTIMAMIDTVEALAGKGVTVHYDIIGDGPDEALLAHRIAESGHRELFRLLPPIPSEGFGSCVRGYSAFFGMGGAVVRAALAGVPAIVAIQREPSAVRYGLFGEKDEAGPPIRRPNTGSSRPQHVHRLDSPGPGVADRAGRDRPEVPAGICCLQRGGDRGEAVGGCCGMLAHRLPHLRNRPGKNSLGNVGITVARVPLGYLAMLLQGDTLRFHCERSAHQLLSDGGVARSILRRVGFRVNTENLLTSWESSARLGGRVDS